MHYILVLLASFAPFDDITSYAVSAPSQARCKEAGQDWSSTTTAAEHRWYVCVPGWLGE